MATRAEHSTAGQPGGHAAGEPAGGERASLPHTRVPGLPAVGMDVIAAAVLVCAPDGTVLDLNRPAAELLGIDPRRPWQAAARGPAMGRHLDQRVG